MNKTTLLPQRKNYKKLLVIMLFIISVNSINGQSYRSQRSYVDDFGRNELFVKESLAE